MSAAMFYSFVGIMIIVTGLRGMVACRHLLRKVLAVNLMGTGIFMFLIALANRDPAGPPDPVPHAMVLTGVVVAISATALVLTMVVRLHAATGKTSFEEMTDEQQEAA
ncbi:MAG: cation:proton antiporter subunit C [Candidatus Omnitrophica bacterium]|nr:cation:proton antiporter subunit C [Candidatus Omnitrophota bacterium]MCB9720161.1 cation:proton antiporter subunit C [Candidatus Omnitrophota bacterium]